MPKNQSPDFRNVKPCSDEEFRIYKSLFTYEKTELNPSVESTQELSRSTYLETVSIDADYESERIPIHIFLPRNSSPPYQTVLYLYGDDAFFKNSIHDINYEEPEIFNKDGRAVVIPAFIGHLERRFEYLDPESDTPPPSWWRDLIHKWYRDMARVIDYLETREDIDTERLAYMGLSGSAAFAVTLLGVEDRIRAAILMSGGIWPLLQEVNPINFMPRIKIPVIMLNGRYDFQFPEKTSQDVMFSLFGTPEEDKVHKKYETGHNIWDRKEWVRDALSFLDKYFGQPKKMAENSDSKK
jgi:predicted esterase